MKPAQTVARRKAGRADPWLTRPVRNLRPYSYPLGIVLFGDSIVLADSVEPTNRGCFNWCNAMLGQAFDIVYNAGIGGNSTTQMLARINSDVISKSPRWVWVEGGINDVAGDFTADTIYNNLMQIYDLLYAQGIRVFATTILPSNTFNGSASRTSVRADVNNRLRAYAATKSTDQYILCDIANLYLDTGSSYAIPLSGYTSDGVHPSALGAGVIGQTMYNTLKSYMSARYSLLPTSDLTNLLWYNSLGAGNPMMTGTGSTVGPATGTTASLFTTTAGGVCSKVAYGDGSSYWQQIVLGAQTTTTLNCLGDITSGWSVGETYTAMLEMQSDNDWVGASIFQLFFQCLNGGTVLLSKHALGYSSAGGSGNSIINPRYAILRTYPMTIPAGTTKIRTYMQFSATSGTIRISRYGIIKTV